MTESTQSIHTEQTSLVDEYLAMRAQAADDKKAAGRLSRLRRKLDGLYWKRVDQLLARRVKADAETLGFTDDERLLIDMGLLDPALVEGADEDLADRLLEELNTPGPNNHLYLSEWLEDRYRRFRFAQDLTDQAEDVADEDESELVRTRRKVMGKLEPLFKDLPGVSEDIARYMVAGQLDDQLLRTDILLLDRRDRKSYLHRHRLASLRNSILVKARARINDRSVLKLFDILDETFVKDWHERFSAHVESGDETETDDARRDDSEVMREAERQRISEYLSSELRFVKTLFPLGALAGGVTQSCAVLLEDTPRVTKVDTERGLALAQSCDRGYNENPVILIAPFKGRGIFEWDRDSFVISLFPVESADDSVANAAGNYRMLTDSLQQDGELRTTYERSFAGVNFQQAFQADYRVWVTRVGRGERSALPEERFDFFCHNVGPDCSNVLAPQALRNLGPQARQAIVKRLRKQLTVNREDGNAHYRLAVLCWLEGEAMEALKHMAIAVKLLPQNGEALFSLGMILREQALTAKAEEVWAACAKRVPESIWRVYAEEALGGRFCGPATEPDTAPDGEEA